MDVVLFCICAVLFGYSYVLYPGLLITIALIRRSPLHVKAHSPTVSIIISAYNEAEVIGRKLENALALEYPAELLEILVISDCSSDATDAIVETFAARGVRLIRQPRRLGKTAGLNRGLDKASGEVVVFTDADALFDSDAVRKLVVYFSDPNVGLVTGSTRYYGRKEGRLVATSSLYTRLERMIKSMETRIGSCVGADGALFGMRRSLYIALSEDDINDFVLPLLVVRQGYRAIFAPDVFCRETASDQTRKEFFRQVRITNRTLDAISRYSGMLNFRRYPLFSFQLVSHKLLRFAVPFFMIALLVLNVQLFDHGNIFVLLMVGQLVCYSAATLGLLLEATGRSTGPAGIFYHFSMMNAAMLVGWYRFFSGRRDVTWDPRAT